MSNFRSSRYSGTMPLALALVGGIMTGAPTLAAAQEPETTGQAGDEGSAVDTPSVADGPTSEPNTALAEEPDLLLRGMRDQRFALALHTPLGGYGELHYNGALGEDGGGDLDLHRLVLFVAHQFSPELRFYGELEVEHALFGADAPGTFAVEQAFIDYELQGERLGLRAGVLLIPMGIINQWHEPPVFLSVERPAVDRRVIPSTWREGGIGIFGRPYDGLSYELYVVGGLNPLGFSASNGLRGGRQHVAEARANALAVTGRLEFEPMSGLIAGVSGYYGEAGQNIDDAFAPDGSELDLAVPILGLSADARMRRAGFELRAVVATFSIGNTAQLRSAIDADGEAIGRDVGSRLLGYYVEAGYDVLRLAGREQELVPFVRYEFADTLAAVKGRDRTEADRAQAVRDLVFGVAYRPIPPVVFKGNVTLTKPDGSAEGTTLLALGVGFMF